MNFSHHMIGTVSTWTDAVWGLVNIALAQDKKGWGSIAPTGHL